MAPPVVVEELAAAASVSDWYTYVTGSHVGGARALDAWYVVSATRLHKYCSVAKLRQETQTKFDPCPQTASQCTCPALPDVLTLAQQHAWSQENPGVHPPGVRPAA